MQFKSKVAVMEDVDLELTSMINIVFLLLSFFLLTGIFDMARMDDKLEVQLPKAAVTTKQIAKKNVIDITVDKRVLLNGLFKTYQELDKDLKQIAKTDPDQIIIIKADKRVTHDMVIKILGLCRKDNLTNIAFAALLDPHSSGFED